MAGASWLCYYKALHTGSASKVVPVDKMSVVLTLILAYFFYWRYFADDASASCFADDASANYLQTDHLLD